MCDTAVEDHLKYRHLSSLYTNTYSKLVEHFVHSPVYDYINVQLFIAGSLSYCTSVTYTFLLEKITPL